ncbi:hypothetical protein [Pyxidicoccus fallax]|uniref:hypothetical protein n=1 Tax=Pyxidicoccus fallax TaxID=394095 RepID=UPI00149505F6|nr:hypothetical protein [Pyxidicoccus fallax]
MSLLWLWLLSPGVAKAEGLAFDFSRNSRSARLVGGPVPSVRGWAAAGQRVRAFTPASVTVTTEDPAIPTHLWLVPVILTGTGLLLGVAWCAALNSSESECNQAMLGGLALGGLASLSYFVVLACVEGGCASECTEEDEDCAEETEGSARSRAARRKLGPPGRALGTRALPLGLSPTVGFVNDRAVFGLGGHF